MMADGTQARIQFILAAEFIWKAVIKNSVIFNYVNHKYKSTKKRPTL